MESNATETYDGPTHILSKYWSNSDHKCLRSPLCEYVCEVISVNVLINFVWRNESNYTNALPLLARSNGLIRFVARKQSNKTFTEISLRTLRSTASPGYPG